MCIPAVAAAALIAGGTAAVGVIQGNQMAKATNRALNAQNAQRKTEIDQATTADINDRLREMRREQSRIMVAAGEAGLSLQSGGVESLLLDSAMQAELANDRSLANRESRRAASDVSTQAQMQSKYTPLGAGLKIGLSAGGAAQNVKNAESRAIRNGG